MACEETMKIDEKLWLHCQALTAGYKPPRKVIPGSPIPRTHLGSIGRVKVYLVDGNAVKLRYKMDFVEGNNSQESSWIPKDELWISDELVPKWWAPVLYHEAHEWRDMRRGMGYDEAHRIANRHEKVLRQRLEPNLPMNLSSREGSGKVEGVTNGASEAGIVGGNVLLSQSGVRPG